MTIRVLHLSTYQRRGGAAIASYRLHQALLQKGVQSEMAVQKAGWSEPQLVELSPGPASAVHLLRKKLDRATVNLAYRRSPRLFSSQWLPAPLDHLLETVEPDIVHVHWITDGFLSVEQLPSISLPIVWTLHDSWAFTGGCHVPQDCRRFEDRCGRCPVLASSTGWDLSRLNHWRKRHAWNDQNFRLIAPSRWMHSQAIRSSLFGDRSISIIPNGFDLQTFRPRAKAAARRRFGLAPEGPVLLYGATLGTQDPNKGFDLLVEALAQLPLGLAKRATVAVCGQASATAPVLPHNIDLHHTGFAETELAMSHLYAAADLTVVPSRQECLPQVAAESLACATPVVGFRTSGLVDVVDHETNGYLAEPFNPKDLSRGIEWTLSKLERDDQLRHAARQKAERSFSDRDVADAHLALYSDMLA